MLVTKITDHVKASLALLLQEYKSIVPQYLMRLNGTPVYTPTGTYTPISTVAPNSSIGFGYGSLVGVAQAFHVSSATAFGQFTAFFQAKGAVSDGLIAAYLYCDNGVSPGIYAQPTGAPIMRSLEAYSATEIADEWTSQGATGYLSKVFTFDFTLNPGYYWLVLGSRFPADVSNCLRLGLHHTGGLALANGFRAGQDITGFFGPNGATGVSQLALTIAEKTSAPPLQPSNIVEVSGMGAFIAALADQCQLLENAIYALNEGRQLYNGSTYPAVGAQLDGIGALVGEPRNGLDDTSYLLFILGKIGENFSNATIPEISNLVSLLFQTSTFKLLQLFPAEIDVQIPTSAGLDPALYPQAINILAGSVGGGIGLGFGSVYPSNSFAFTKVGGPQVGGGFSSVSDPSAGGGFAKLFYNDPGV